MSLDCERFLWCTPPGTGIMYSTHKSRFKASNFLLWSKSTNHHYGNETEGRNAVYISMWLVKNLLLNWGKEFTQKLKYIIHGCTVSRNFIFHRDTLCLASAHLDTCSFIQVRQFQKVYSVHLDVLAVGPAFSHWKRNDQMNRINFLVLLLILFSFKK